MKRPHFLEELWGPGVHILGPGVHILGPGDLESKRVLGSNLENKDTLAEASKKKARGPS